jgi:hypothetical protein
MQRSTVLQLVLVASASSKEGDASHTQHSKEQGKKQEGVNVVSLEAAVEEEELETKVVVEEDDDEDDENDEDEEQQQ